MRPSLLDPYFAPVAGLPGIGPKTARLFDRLLADQDGGARVVDLLFHLPHAAIDRRVRGGLLATPPGAPGTFLVTVEEHRPPPIERPKSPYRVVCADGHGADVALVFFHGNRGALEKILPVGARRFVSGKLELWDGRLQMVHPDRILDEAGKTNLPDFEPVYGLTDGLSQRVVARTAQAALARAQALPEWADPHLLAAHGLPDFLTALRNVHGPQSDVALGERDPARRRLAHDELLAGQLALYLLRSRRRIEAGTSRAGPGDALRRLLATLPFQPTGAQSRAIAEITADLALPKRMLRLLQGDVGAGKTLVAVAAMASVAETGAQAALMAPTELLARQHFGRIGPMLEAAGFRGGLLTGADRSAARQATLAGLADGSIDIVVGTHALFQAEVRFRDLALAIVDEQHRFGVHQRLALANKGEGVDVLVMTATPIPRTLVLSYFGDIDVSVLDEKPSGRRPIDTRVLSDERLEDVVGAVGRALADGAQVYWVCPLVAEGEDVELVSAEQRCAALTKRFGDRVGLIHGQLSTEARNAAMERFVAGDTRVLVATTVIEVGVDIPNATIMVVENAERFGLAQLHQLRGRVGRGEKPSVCLLVYRAPLGATAQSRLGTLRATEDGFRIAEEDLRLRGEGDLLGSRQAGLPGFRVAHPEWDRDLIAIARSGAKSALTADPRLETERGQALRMLLYLFSRDDAVRMIGAG